MTCLPWLDTLTTGLPQPPESRSSKEDYIRGSMSPFLTLSLCTSEVLGIAGVPVQQPHHTTRHFKLLRPNPHYFQSVTVSRIGNQQRKERIVAWFDHSCSFLTLRYLGPPTL
ncbi:hypothetical protein TNCV_3629191 [Trichonephila clavipes]|nr:hypothetical protein TNCV_3629191 [Trichonephila clavipes]